MKVKKLLTYFALGVLSVGMTTSCSDYLDKEPDTELTTDMVFTNRDKVYSWLAYVYNVIHTPDKYALTSDGYEIFADDLTASQRWEQWDWGGVIPKIHGQWTINSTWGGNLWHMMPRYIRHIYIFQKNLHALPDQDLPQSEIDLMLAETKFLAAYGWWQMAENYGGIPFKPDFIAPTDFDLDDLMVGQSKFDDVVDYCDKEMKAAAEKLPSVYSDPAKYGRITSVMALTVRARMLLFAASPLCNGNTWYDGDVYKNYKGEKIFNTEYNHEKWKRAIDAIEDLLAACGNDYELYTVPAPSGAIDPFMSTYEVQWKKWSEGNHEITFPVTKGSQYHGTLLRVATVRDFGGGNGLGVYQGLVDAFFDRNGYPIDDPNSVYRAAANPDAPANSDFSTAVDKRDTYWKYGTGEPGEITAAKTFNMYCNREPRFYNAVTYNGSWLAYAERAADFSYNGLDNIRTSSPHDAPQNGYLTRKGLNMEDNYKTGAVTSRQDYMYRLAFTYLDYAEALNEYYDDTPHRQTSLDYVNKIRERAGVRPYTFASVDPVTGTEIHVDDNREAVRNIVRMERRVELCCEGNRWYDIRRWKIAEELPEMTGACYGINCSEQIKKKNDLYKIVKFDERIWKRQYYWIPIYIDEYEKNPNLVEGPYWQ